MLPAASAAFSFLITLSLVSVLACGDGGDGHPVHGDGGSAEDAGQTSGLDATAHDGDAVAEGRDAGDGEVLVDTETADGDTSPDHASDAGGGLCDTMCPARCVASPLGATCTDDLSTERMRGTLAFELRRPNEQRSDWDAQLSTAAARGFWVISYRGDDVVDSALTGAEGQFELHIPSEPSVQDSLVVLAFGSDERGELAYAVADPGFSPAAQPHASSEPFPQPRVWSWRFASARLRAGEKLIITEAAGSGAAYVFDSLRSVFELGKRAYPSSPTQSVVAWLGIGTSWQCSACYSPGPAVFLSHQFLHQLRFDGSPDQGYWSDAVTRHELGHYLMNAFGVSPRESSPRFFGDRTHPGLAWQEGWATYFSASDRGSPLYYDKQADGFFWFDIEARHYAFDDLAWQRPEASDGLDQLIDENEVASMLYECERTLGQRTALLAALASPRMVEPPFERGYFKRVWSDADHPETYAQTDASVPYLADFLDALRCEGAISGPQLDGITKPTTNYPYPSANPLCR